MLQPMRRAAPHQLFVYIQTSAAAANASDTMPGIINEWTVNRALTVEASRLTLPMLSTTSITFFTENTVNKRVFYDPYME